MSGLTNLFTGIAEALREKKKTTAPIPAQRFTDEIRGIDTVEVVEGSLGSLYLAPDTSTPLNVLRTEKKLRNVQGGTPESIWAFSPSAVKRCTLESISVDGAGYIYVGAEDKTVRKISPEGVVMWSFTGHTGIVEVVAADTEGNVYSASSDKTFRKISPEGVEVWRHVQYNSSQCIAVDSAGCIYVDAFGDRLDKFNPDGTDCEISCYINEGTIHSATVDTDGYIYIGDTGTDDTGGVLRKFNSEGTRIWDYTNYFGDIVSVAVDGNGYIHVAKYYSYTYKVSPNGVKVWTYQDAKSLEYGVVDSAGYMYVGGYTEPIRKLSPYGELTWEYMPPDTENKRYVRAMAIGLDGSVYAAVSSYDYESVVHKIKNNVTIENIAYYEN